MNILQALQQYLAETQAGAMMRPENQGAALGGLPPGLPPEVVRSIVGGPSYGEGEMTPYIRGDPSAILQEAPLRQGPQRDQRLMDQLFASRQYGPQGGVVNEGSGWAGWGMQNPQRVYPERVEGPLNQFMPGAGLY